MTDDKKKGFGFGAGDDLQALMSELEGLDLDAEVRKLGGEPTTPPKPPTTPVPPPAPPRTASSEGLGFSPAVMQELRRASHEHANRPPPRRTASAPSVRTPPRRTASSSGMHTPPRRTSTVPPGMSAESPAALRAHTGPQAPMSRDQEVAALREQSQRQAAKFDNYRKRLTKEKQEAVQFANERLMKDLLPSIDNLVLALEHSDATDKEQLIMGVQMTLDMLMSALGRYGLEGFNSKDKAFDPKHHQALNQVNDPSVPANTVVKVAQRGYKLHGRLLRPALVTVSVGGLGRHTQEGLPAATDGPQTTVATPSPPPAVSVPPAPPQPPSQTSPEIDLGDLELELAAEAPPPAPPQAPTSPTVISPPPEASAVAYDLADLQDALDSLLEGE